jgi:Rhs element Vgr protein
MADSPENNTDGPVGVTIKLNGTEMQDDMQLLSLRVVNELNRIPEATFTLLADSLQFEDFEAVDSNDFKLGTEVEISAYYGSNTATVLFKGIILSNRVRLDGRRGLRMEMTCRDKAMQMTEVRASTQYEEQKDSDIMSSLISDAGLTADVAATTEQAPLNLRVGATAWDFLRLLADRNGQVVFVDEGKVTTVVPDTSASAVLTVSYGIDIMELDVAIDAHRMIAKAKALAWSEKDQQSVSGEYGTLSNPSVGNTTASDIAAVLADREQLSSTAREFTKADLDAFTKARLERAGLATVRGMVKFQGSGAIKPLNMLEITGAGERFSGNGFVVSVEHTIDSGSWTTQARMGLPQDWTSDTGGLAAPAAEGLTTPIHGLQIGKVVQLDEDPEGKQRIQVTLPMIGDPPAAVWARFATPYASNEIGIQFLPEIDDEVLVAFLNADPNAPVIVGALHNDKAQRPVAADADNTIKTITTREKMKITFDEGKKIITVETPGRHKLVMDDDATTFSMEDMNGNSIVMDPAGITISSDADITITAKKNISAEAIDDAKVKGSNVTCDASMGFTGKGGSSAEVSSGGTTKVEGSMVTIN